MREADECCEPILAGKQVASTAEALMRARYVAYTRADIPFIARTTHPNKRHQNDLDAMRSWAEQAQWQKLEVLAVKGGSADKTRGEVEFRAFYQMDDKPCAHHELSRFRREGRQWFFYSGTALSE